MTESISQGDFQAYPAGTQMLVRVRSGEVKLGDHPNTAQRQIASYTPDNGWISWTPSHAERLVVYGVQTSEVDVQYNDGFSISLFGLPVLDVDSDTPNAPDYRNQTQRIPAEGVVEVNADISQTVGSGGGSVTVTITSDPDEVWILSKAEIEATEPDNSATGTHDFDIISEEQGVELAFGAQNGDQPLRYRSGSWIGSTTRGSGWDAEDIRVDENSGIEITYTNDSNIDQTQTVTIRLKFNVIRT